METETLGYLWIPTNLFKIVELIVRDAPVKAGIGMNQAAKGVLQFAIIGLIMAGAAVAVFEVAHVADVGYPFAKDGAVAVYFAYASSLPNYQLDQYALVQPSSGDLGPPERPIVLSLDVTINSVEVTSNEETGWTVISSETVTLDLMKQSGETIQLGLTNIVEQNIAMVRMHVASASAAVEYSDGTQASREVRVPSGELKIPVMAEIRGQLTTSITITPDMDAVKTVTQTDPIILRPTILLTKVAGPQ